MIKTKNYCRRFILIGVTMLLMFGAGDFNFASVKDKNAKMLNTIDFKVSFSREKADSLIIRYEITNKSKRNVFLLNKGDNLSPAKDKAVYIEPQKDGTIEISRGGLPNAATPDRSPTFPVEYGVTKLAPKETFKEEFTITLPLQPDSPFRSYTNNPIAMPESIKQIRFCLGVIQDSKIKIKTSAFPVLENYVDVLKQKLLCSEDFNF